MHLMYLSGFEMKVPQGVSVSESQGIVTASGTKGSVSKQFNLRLVKLSVKPDEVGVEGIGKLTRSKKAAVNAVERHLKNMFDGVLKGFSKKLTVVYAHFPVAIEVKGAVVLIKNFLGEKSPRTAKIVPGVQVKADKQEITVTGADCEAVGQTAANIIQAAKITRRDIRVFQDGIYHAD